jgi:aconitate hydratase
VVDRATIANMAPEYGATVGFFPVDEQTLNYMRLTGRDENLIKTVEQYCKAQGLWRNDADPIAFSDVVELDLGTVEPSLAGPRRPQDRVALSRAKQDWQKQLQSTYGKPRTAATMGGTNMEAEGDSATVTADADAEGVEVEMNGQSFALRHGSVVIAAITSCTNTSNPDVMVAAGLVARKARALGLKTKAWVKTSLAPGSKAVTEYLDRSGLTPDLDALGFNLVGYGCTTCIGNSGPLPEPISKAIGSGDLVVASVLSGNRNFEGRVHAEVKANYLASPPLVVVYALAGTMDIDLEKEPLGVNKDGRPVYMRDIWPTQKEVADLVASAVSREQFTRSYGNVFEGSAQWKKMGAAASERYAWDAKSTYIQRPPFFEGLKATPAPIRGIRGARCLAKLGDSVTTDHISPAGSIKKDSPAGKYLRELGVEVSDFNSYGSRRGNDRVMTRGTFANVRIRNQLAPGTEGGVTMDFLDGQVKPIYDAAMHYKEKGTALIILAGKDYGMGSSRDWAAKGAFLLGVRAVIAESFERIHRSNLVGMGVLPLCFKPGETAAKLGLRGDEVFDIELPKEIKPKQEIKVTARPMECGGADPALAGSSPQSTSGSASAAGGAGGRSKAGEPITFTTICRIDTPVEVDYYRNGGILQTVLRKMI